MGMDFVDIYFVNDYLEETPQKEILYSLDTLIRSGRVKEIGFSDFPAWMLAKICTISEFFGWKYKIFLQLSLSRYPVAIQTRYNLLDQSYDADLRAMCTDMNLNTCAWGIFAEGKLTRKSQNSKIYDEMEQLSSKHQLSMAQLCIKWALKNPSISSVLLGVKTASQLIENFRTFELADLPNEEWEKLESFSSN